MPAPFDPRLALIRISSNLCQSSYALRDYGVTRWLVKEGEILDFGLTARCA